MDSAPINESTNDVSRCVDVSGCSEGNARKRNIDLCEGAVFLQQKAMEALVTVREIREETDDVSR